jgi:hypothetical protein
MVATLIITELSYTFVETPIRRGEWRAWWVSLRTRRDPVPRQIVAVTVVVAMLLLAFGAVRLATANVQENEIAQALDEGEGNVTSLEDLVDGEPDVEPGADGDGELPATQTTQPADSVPVVTDPTATTTTTTTTSTTTTTTLPAEPIDFLAIGDSVMLGAAGTLSERGYTVDAQKSRQMIDMIPTMQALGENELFGDPVVVHLGTNGPITSETLNEFLAPLSSVPNVLLLTNRGPRSWIQGNNALIRARDNPGDNIILVDWEQLSNNCAGNCFASDGIHLSADGVQYYANMIGDITGR